MSLRLEGWVAALIAGQKEGAEMGFISERSLNPLWRLCAKRSQAWQLWLAVTGTSQKEGAQKIEEAHPYAERDKLFLLVQAQEEREASKRKKRERKKREGEEKAREEGT